MTVRVFGGSEIQLGRTDMVTVRAQRNLSKTDYTNSVGPILVISFPESWSGKLGGTDYSNLVGPILVISFQRVCIVISVVLIAQTR